MKKARCRWYRSFGDDCSIKPHRCRALFCSQGYLPQFIVAVFFIWTVILIWISL